LEYAKRNGKDFVIFQEEMRERVIEKMELQNAIIKALEEQAITEIKKQFELYFQPILSLVMIEGRIRSAHPLAPSDQRTHQSRVIHPRGGRNWTHHPHRELGLLRRGLPSAELADRRLRELYHRDKPIAEGIESPEQLRCLFNLGCRRIQGHYFHTPLSGKDFAEYLRDNMRPRQQ
jgi:predicted signal transduction protein with EAL and GGDEF domain